MKFLFCFAFIAFGWMSPPAEDDPQRLIICHQGTCTTIEDDATCTVIILLDDDDSCTGQPYGCGSDEADAAC